MARVFCKKPGIALAMLLLFVLPAAGQPKPIAIADFSYSDTSGEVQDQTAKHKDFLRAFMAQLGEDLAKSDRYRIVSLACDPDPCTDADPSKLLAGARRAGAALLLYGGIHKESTLVQWAKIEMADVKTGQQVYERLLTFRGDDARAWQRAEAFIAADLKAHGPAE